jgi:hypothetical protein
MAEVMEIGRQYDGVRPMKSASSMIFRILLTRVVRPA